MTERWTIHHAEVLDALASMPSRGPYDARQLCGMPLDVLVTPGAEGDEVGEPIRGGEVSVEGRERNDVVDIELPLERGLWAEASSARVSVASARQLRLRVPARPIVGVEAASPCRIARAGHDDLVPTAEASAGAEALPRSIRSFHGVWLAWNFSTALRTGHRDGVCTKNRERLALPRTTALPVAEVVRLHGTFRDRLRLPAVRADNVDAGLPARRTAVAREGRVPRCPHHDRPAPSARNSDSDALGQAGRASGVLTRPGTELRAVPRAERRRGSAEFGRASCTPERHAIAECSRPHGVRARARARRLSTVLQARRVGFVGHLARRTCALDRGHTEKVVRERLVSNASDGLFCGGQS